MSPIDGLLESTSRALILTDTPGRGTEEGALKDLGRFGARREKSYLLPG